MPFPPGHTPSRLHSTYLAPRGKDPVVYIHELGLQADELCRERDFAEALRILHKRLAVVSYYRGSRTVHAAQAMAKLASVERLAGHEQDAQTWAYYAMRAYATLMMDNEAPHKQHIAESLALLDQSYPGLLERSANFSGAVPDFTTGKLRYPVTTVSDSPAQLPIPSRRILP